MRLNIVALPNVEVIGEQNGRINYYEFDLIASVVETSGFLELPDDDDGDCISTVGDTVITVTFSDGRERVFTRDAMNEPPIFWAVAKLMEKLLEKAKWGQSEYDQAPVHFAAREAGNNAVHTKPPIARLANGERVSGGSVTAVVRAIKSWPTTTRMFR